MYMRKRRKDTRSRQRETREMAKNLVLQEADEQRENLECFGTCVYAILKFCYFMCGGKLHE